MYRQILLPSDLHDLNTDAVHQTAELASRHHAAVSLLHVIEPIPGLDDAELRDFYEGLEKTANEKFLMLSQVFLDKHIPCTCKVSIGNRAQSIVLYAMEVSADLIVLQSHRISPDFVDGTWDTISYKVAIFAQCPVLLVK